MQVSLLNTDRTAFFVSHKPPYHVVKTKTLSRWMSELLTAAGVDTSIFKPHSTRAAAGNYLRKSLSSTELCKLADWSTTSGVYQQFYQQYLWSNISTYLHCVLVPIYSYAINCLFYRIIQILWHSLLYFTLGKLRLCSLPVFEADAFWSVIKLQFKQA